MRPVTPRSWLLSSTPARPGCGLATIWRFWLPGVPEAMQWLALRGLCRGKRVGALFSNLPSCAAMLQAMPMQGLTTVLFNRRLHARDLAAQIRRSNLDTLLVSPQLAGSAPDLLPMHVLPEEFTAQPADDGSDPPDCPAFADYGRPGDNPCLVLYTSGTSGQAKAARLPIRAVLHAAAAAQERLALSARDTWLCCLPLDHIGGASILYRAGICGYSVLLMERFDAHAANRALDKTRVTGASVVPTMLHRLVEERGRTRFPRHLRILLTGGAPLSAALARSAARLGRPPCPTYGLTEAASQVCTPSPRAVDPAAGHCGPAVAGMQIRIRTASGRPCPPGLPGLIEVRGDSLFQGYEEHGVLCRRKRGWFATGDLGTLDAGGNLSVHARRTDVILSGGENIYPAELEAQLECHPAIAEAGVVGLSDEEWGQVVAAVLVPRRRAVPDATLVSWLKRSISAFKRPRRWRWVTALPRTATGKLQRHLLLDWQQGPWRPRS